MMAKIVGIASALAIVAAGSIYAIEKNNRHEHYESMLALCSLHTAGLHGWEGELEKSIARRTNCESRAYKNFNK